MNLEKYQQYSRIARGLEQADLVLKDARIINVFTEEIIRGDIGRFMGIHNKSGGSVAGSYSHQLCGRYQRGFQMQMAVNKSRTNIFSAKIPFFFALEAADSCYDPILNGNVSANDAFLRSGDRNRR